MREDLLTDSKKNLLPRSSDIDPLGMKDVAELNNPYFKKPPAKPDHVPNLLSKHKKKKTHTITSAAAATATTTTTKSYTDVAAAAATTTMTAKICTDVASSQSSSISTKPKRIHPWFMKMKMKNENISDEKCSKKNLTNGMKMTEENIHIGEEETETENEVQSSEQKSSPNFTDGMKMREEKTESENMTQSSEQNWSCKKNIKYTQRRKLDISNKKAVLSIAEHEEAYPWATEAAKNREKKSPLAPNITQLNEKAHKILSKEMKSKLYEHIEYPEIVIQKINKNIEKQDGKFVCVRCKSFSNTRKVLVIRHLTAELGYFKYKCSFCDEKANDNRTIINHYTLQHDIPSSWIENN